ncbi:ATP-binding cassette domain-containing protein [Gordonia pseudamarae]|jgi:iron complex transport system ATP-binding protein|uniref:ATP-binding cassette domain-containing protein n=1 Tax=Gordonia pseudamarae TaxID=2831662 RepID=A0ABX6IFE6_9ACTN|nr:MULTISPECIES: ABC transporter ATP-binding protein [Gordonia]MBD0020541.1 ABC transporter ATP-binding protein [Gordonia sp. (in: high G+C Gram-positive bacteria)]QHN25624.1 ATP-binding cassette domain-containing protein [Gordonia pseudamarae]QHN34557.1 ATP-binding cassette domain-containing protein [Gordonia pseudamarae]
MSSSPIALSAKGIEVRIDGRRILDDVELDVPAGSIVGIVGPNGSGKSTLMRTVVGLQPMRSGTVEIAGRRADTLRARERARLIAFVGQEVDLPPDLLVHEYVALGRLPYSQPWSMGRADDRRAVMRALNMVDMAAYRDTPVERLSGGERRRVALARGLAQHCGLLVLDEPTNHLDIRHQIGLLNLLPTLGTTILVSLHDLDLAAHHCDSLVVLHDGRVRAAGPGDLALSTSIVDEVFGVHACRLVDPSTGRAHLVFDSPPPEEGRRP